MNAGISFDLPRLWNNLEKYTQDPTSGSLVNLLEIVTYSVSSTSAVEIVHFHATIHL